MKMRLKRTATGNEQANAKRKTNKARRGRRQTWKHSERHVSSALAGLRGKLRDANTELHAQLGVLSRKDRAESPQGENDQPQGQAASRQRSFSA